MSFKPVYNYYYKIPEAIYKDTVLTPTAKLLYGIIFRYHKNGKVDYCWSGDESLALLLNTSVFTIDRSLKQLAKQGHIQIIPKTKTKKRKLYALTEIEKEIPYDTRTSSKIE